MKIFDLFNSSKKQITLEEKYDDIVDNVLLKDNSNINDVENIKSLTKLIVTWFKIQFETELNKYNVKEEKISDFLDRDVYQLLDVYDVSSLTNFMHQKINKKLFQKYEDNPKFKEKIHEASLYELMNITKSVEYGLVFCKLFDLKLSLAMKYLPGSKLNDEELMRRYLENRGNPNIDFYPNYFKINSKNRFYSENLNEKLLEYNNNKIIVKK